MDYYPLEPDRAGMAEMGNLVLGQVMDFIEGLPDRPASTGAGPSPGGELVRAFLTPPPEGPGDLKALLDHLGLATDSTLETAGPGFLGHVPGGGLYSSALAEFYTRAINRHGSVAFAAPPFAALEESVLRWMAQDVYGHGTDPNTAAGGGVSTMFSPTAWRATALGAPRKFLLKTLVRGR